jgi:hypothetical protein
MTAGIRQYKLEALAQVVRMPLDNAGTANLRLAVVVIIACVWNVFVMSSRTKLL